MLSSEFLICIDEIAPVVVEPPQREARESYVE